MNTYTFELTFKLHTEEDLQHRFGRLFKNAELLDSIPGWLRIRFTKKALQDFEAYNEAITEVRKTNIVPMQLIRID